MRRSAKWSLYAPDVLPLPVAEMDVELAPAVAEALHAAVDRSDTGYAPMDGGHVRAFASFAWRRWGWSVDPSLVVPAPDVGSAIVQVLTHATGPGPVVVSPPVYPQFHSWPGAAGRGVVSVPLASAAGGAETMEYRLDLDALERAFAAGASAYVLCHPHNPVGRVHARDELVALARLAQRYGVLVVSDEVHAPLVFGGCEFVPFLDSCAEAEGVGVAVQAPSKAWNLAGLKCAFIVAGDPAHLQRLAPVIDELPWQVGIFGAFAAEAAYLHAVEWLDDLVAQLPRHHALLASALGRHLPEARVGAAQFGYLAWVDLSALNWPGDPADLALAHGKVALGIGPAFGVGGERHVRVNVGARPEVIEEAVARLVTTDRAVRATRA